MTFALDRQTAEGFYDALVSLILFASIRFLMMMWIG